MQNESPFGITSGGIGTSGSCVGGNKVAIIPWATAKAEVEGYDLSSWLGLEADAATSAMSSMSEDEQKKLTETATTRALPYELAKIRDLISRESFDDETVLVTVGIMIEQIDDEAAEAAKAK
jgi:hypothetical protein